MLPDPPNTTERPYHHGNLRASLLTAALALAEESGLQAFTLREVARRAGVSHNAPYRHFKSKEDLIAALATSGFHKLNEFLREALTSSVNPIQRLRQASRAYLQFGISNPAEFGVMFHGAFDRLAYVEYVEAYTESLKLLTELMTACGDLGVEGTETAGELVWASVHGITELGLSKRLREGQLPMLEEMVDSLIASLLDGMNQALKRSSN